MIISDVTQILFAIEQADQHASEQLLDEFVENQAAEMGESENSQVRKWPANTGRLSFLDLGGQHSQIDVNDPSH